MRSTGVITRLTCEGFRMAVLSYVYVAIGAAFIVAAALVVKIGVAGDSPQPPSVMQAHDRPRPASLNTANTTSPHPR